MKLHANKIDLNISDEGRRDGAPVLFLHPLGLNLRVWDDVFMHLSKELRLVRLDMRGHGASEVPPAPYAMGTLIRDVEGVCDALQIRDAVVVGNSIGGLIAQGVAAKRLDIVRGAVLAGTAPKIGTRALWEDRMALVAERGMEGIADWTLTRWFSKNFEPVDKWRRELLACHPQGHMGCSAAIAGTDFYSTTAALRLPVLVTAGTEDDSTPPDLVRELADLIPGSEFQLMRGSGHVPAADAPEEFAQLVTRFLERIGHGQV